MLQKQKLFTEGELRLVGDGIMRVLLVRFTFEAMSPAPTNTDAIGSSVSLISNSGGRRYTRVQRNGHLTGRMRSSR
jgi:hypothetical protein